MKKYKLTLIGVIIALLIGILSYTIDLDPFDHLVRFFHSVEQYELDEIFIGLLIILIFFIADLVLARREEKIELEKLKIYKAMVYSTHHILNNFLNQMLLFKITAENTPGFDKKILEMYDKIIEETNKQIRDLSSVENIDEETIKEAISPKKSST